jgi:hypothetical protein
LTEIPETLLENQMLISGMLFRNFQTISRGCPQIGNSEIFEVFKTFPNQSCRRMLKEEI